MWEDTVPRFVVCAVLMGVWYATFNDLGSGGEEVLGMR